MEPVKRSGVKEGGINKRTEHRGFGGQCNYTVRYHHYGYVIIHLSKPIECTTPREDLVSTMDLGSEGESV